MRHEKCTCDESEDHVEVSARGWTPRLRGERKRQKEVKGQEVDGEERRHEG